MAQPKNVRCVNETIHCMCGQTRELKHSCDSPHAFAAEMQSSSATYSPGGNVRTLSE